MTTCPCGNQFEAHHNREKYCSDCQPERRQAWNRAYRDKRREQKIGELLGRNTYRPERLDYLAAAVLGRAYKDATIRYDHDTREHITREVKRAARAWWNSNAVDWCECLGVSLALPAVPAPEPGEQYELWGGSDALPAAD
jgi:hypothetical protein